MLHFRSHHPRHTLKAIPVGELTRAKRNCSSDENYIREANRICTSLKSRGYPDWVLHRAKNIVEHKQRNNFRILKFGQDSGPPPHSSVRI